ncbi:MAG: cob(I)yrinic acid a,c-diamide adenosyltransferase [Flavobacteriales bacterium]|nr:cob(I)yrinic acid a,c-diamide adenosyltransferase [Flavobacteriales bacterium]
MKIYTKKGDTGSTSLLGGTLVPKHHLRIEAYGTVDELNSHIGLLRDVAGESHQTMLLEIQERLFTLGSHLALDPAHEGKMKLPHITESDVQKLEQEMDQMELQLPEMRNFILPGGHPSASQCHIVRCVCRRAERCLTALHEQEATNPVLLIYLNRLSDYFFVLSRKISQENDVLEIPWKPRG